MSTLAQHPTSPLRFVLTCLFQGAALSSLLSPAIAQLDSTPVTILPDLSYAIPLDLDGDGRDEIVSVSHTNQALVAFNLNADGTLRFDRRLANLAVVDTHYEGRWTLELIDMDGDGRDDLVQADDRGAYIFYDRGGPQFEERVQIDSIPRDREIVTLDVDADGDLDVLTLPATGSGTAVRWIENLGGGAFVHNRPLQTGAANYDQLIPVDIDADGDLDLAGFRRTLGVTTNVPVIVRNLGGTFQVEDLGLQVPGLLAVQAGDVDDDGDADLLFRRWRSGLLQIELYRNEPSGLQGPTVVLSSPVPFYFHTLANPDGSGANELVLVGYSNGIRSIQTFEWSSQGMYVGPQSTLNVPPSDLPQMPVQRADFDGDGNEDLLVRWTVTGEISSYGPFGPRALRGGASAGIPVFEAPIRLMDFSAELNPAERYLAGDIDGDGVTDLVQSRRADLQWQRGRAGSVSFDSPVRIADAAKVELVVDLNSDGLPEIVVSTVRPSGAIDWGLIENLGGGNFGPLQTLNNSFPGVGNVAFQALDFDSDGDLDLIPAPESTLFVWMENLGGLTLAIPAALGVHVTGSTLHLHAGDLDGDGDVDFLEETFNFPSPTDIGWYEGLGGGVFSQRQALGVTVSNRTVEVLDVNEDGIDDVIYAASGQTFVLAGTASGPRSGGTALQLFNTSFIGLSVELLDVNDDGLTDFVTSSGTSQAGMQPVFLRTGPLAFGATPFALAPRHVRLFDFGGDGDLDGLGAVNDLDWVGQIDVIYEGLSRGISGTPYCGPAVPNSSGSPAALLALGTNEAQINELRLRVNDAARFSFGFFLVSPQSQPATPVVGSAGRLCLGGSIGRYVSPGQVQSTGTTGSFQLGLDLSSIPTPMGPTAALPGATWFFQAWFRDFAPTGPTSNFTDGVEVNFQ